MEQPPRTRDRYSDNLTKNTDAGFNRFNHREQPLRRARSNGRSTRAVGQDDPDRSGSLLRILHTDHAAAILDATPEQAVAR
jgi:hypothetical protein